MLVAVALRATWLETLKVAVTVLSATMLMLQVAPDGESQPDQAPKAEPDVAIAVRATEAPEAYEALQEAPQLMPGGDDVTVPVPLPLFNTVRVWFDALNVAVTVLSDVMLIVHVDADGESQPDQFTNVEPAAAAAVRATDVPEAYEALHEVPQLIPAGEEVTVPIPVPAFATLRT
jgi:hypothetical protein